MTPARGEVWLADLDPVRGYEQAGRRPVLIVSDDRMNRSAARLAIAVPFTSVEKGIVSHVSVEPPEGDLRRRSYVKPEDVRSVSFERLIERWGAVRPETMARVERALRALLGL
jgi:mRNA interferase MazF